MVIGQQWSMVKQQDVGCLDVTHNGQWSMVNGQWSDSMTRAAVLM
jgi:hypothetical protein